MRIEKLIYGGAGLAREQGKVALVPFTLPGEEVEIEALADRKDLTQARLKRVLAQAPERIQPGCPHFTICGGCHYQHIGYATQVAWKKDILRETLRRTGKIEPPAEIRTIASEPWGYRNRVQIHFSGRKTGFLEPGSNAVRDVEQCPVASPKVNEVLRAIRKMAGDRRFPAFVKTIELFSNETDVQLNILATEGNQRVARGFFEWAAEQIPGMAGGSIDYPAAGELFRVGHRSFFQVNRFLIDDLAAAALEDSEGETAFDLYAGAGLFSLPLARRFEHVTAVESGAGALEDLKFNARRAGLELCAVRQAVDLFLESESEPPDLVVADPPRAGLGKTVVRELARLRSRQLRIVACDPVTLARDLSGLLGAGYSIRRMVLLDLFPQTFHLETVVHLELAG